MGKGAIAGQQLQRPTLSRSETRPHARAASRTSGRRWLAQYLDWQYLQSPMMGAQRSLHSSIAQQDLGIAVDLTAVSTGQRKNFHSVLDGPSSHTKSNSIPQFLSLFLALAWGGVLLPEPDQKDVCKELLRDSSCVGDSGHNVNNVHPHRCCLRSIVLLIAAPFRWIRWESLACGTSRTSS